MGFLSRLFGNSKKLSLQDKDLGNFSELSHNGAGIIWKGQIKIFDETMALYMSGNSTDLIPAEKTSLFDILRNESTVESEVNDALRIQYEEAGKQYYSWRAHFNCITMSTMGDQISITFEEKDSFYHFNVFLVNCKNAGVSIDS